MPSPTTPTKPAAAASDKQPLHIFRPGRFTDMSGKVVEFTEPMLRATCAAYDPAKHEAPLVIGHPKHDAPAYAWTQSLSYGEGGVYANLAQVNPDAADLLAAGAYKKISARFYEPDAVYNPTPGVYALKDIGLLGAMPPAVKGLQQAVSFAENETGVVCFSEWDDRTNAGLWRRMREWVIAKFGLEEADKVIPSYDVADLERSAEEEIAQAQAEAAAIAEDKLSNLVIRRTADTTLFSEHQPKDITTMTPEQIAAMQAENDKLKKQLAADKAAKTHAANVAFCESIPANKLLPAHRPVAVAMLDNLAAQPGTVQFGEGDEQVPLADKFKAFLKGLPDTVQFGEIATNGNSAKTTEANPLLADADARVGR